MTAPGYPGFGENLRQPPLRPGDELAGKYRIEQVVGSGAMGVVVLASHIELEQPVAIKFLYPELAANVNGAERFRREARAAVRIRNEHVARVLDVGMLEEQGIPFIVMEYLHGRDLARELKERGTLPAREAVRYILEACEAVAEAHEHGIVHRDLKPANLFLMERSNGTRMIKVLDFGISKLLSGQPQRLSITDTAILMGSPAYMSPEQLESSRSVDGRSDIWSLGVILYELCTGNLPFDGDSVPQLVRAVVSGARAPLAGADPTLAELEPVVARCLQQERGARFQSIDELCAALSALPSIRAVPWLELGRTILGQPLPDATGTPGAASPDITASPGIGSAPGVTPAPPARDGSNGADGAWGRTHGGRRGSWHRRWLPLAALLGLVAVAGFWVIRIERQTALDKAAAQSLVPMPAAHGASAATQRDTMDPATTLEPHEKTEPRVAPLVETAPPASVTLAPPEPGVAAPGVAAAGAVVKPPAPPVVVNGAAANAPAPTTKPAAPTAVRAVAPAAPAAAASAAHPAAAAAEKDSASGNGKDAPHTAPTPVEASVPGGDTAARDGQGNGHGEGKDDGKADGAEPPPGARDPNAPKAVPSRDGRFEILEFGGRE